MTAIHDLYGSKKWRLNQISVMGSWGTPFLTYWDFNWGQIPLPFPSLAHFDPTKWIQHKLIIWVPNYCIKALVKSYLILEGIFCSSFQVRPKTMCAGREKVLHLPHLLYECEDTMFPIQATLIPTRTYYTKRLFLKLH